MKARHRLSIFGSIRFALTEPLGLRHVHMESVVRINIQDFSSLMIAVSLVEELDINIWSVLFQVDLKIPSVRKLGSTTMRNERLLAGIVVTKGMVIGDVVQVAVRPLAPGLMLLGPTHVILVSLLRAHEAKRRAEAKVNLHRRLVLSRKTKRRLMLGQLM